MTPPGLTAAFFGCPAVVRAGGPAVEHVAAGSPAVAPAAGGGEGQWAGRAGSDQQLCPFLGTQLGPAASKSEEEGGGSSLTKPK